jgi:hypothetical protein
MSLDKLHEGGASPAQIADAASSPFAIQAFHVHTDFGGNEALARLKQRANRAGLRLMIDFVPNHVAKDHRCVDCATRGHLLRLRSPLCVLFAGMAVSSGRSPSCVLHAALSA